MATIAISDLHPAGYDLFSDSESYISSLSEDELGLQGGGTPIVITTIPLWKLTVAGSAVVGTFAASYVVSRYR